MSTVGKSQAINLAQNEGWWDGDRSEPRCLKIVKYLNQFDGKPAYGCVFEGEDPMRYEKCRRPTVIWDAGWEAPPGFFAVERVSPRTGRVNRRLVPGSLERYLNWLDGEGLIQDILPNATPADREFLMTGLTEEDWEEIFPKGERE